MSTNEVIIVTVLVILVGYLIFGKKLGEQMKGGQANHTNGRIAKLIIIKCNIASIFSFKQLKFIYKNINFIN